MSLDYFKNLISDINVASIAPTSSFGVKRITDQMDFAKAKVFVEYGPGNGVITKPILELMAPDAVFIAIEKNPNFATSLRQEITDPRFKLFEDDAENVLEILEACGVTAADYVFSGIPFSLFDVPKKDRILKATKTALGDEGTFIVYQFLVSAGKRAVDIKHKLNEHMVIVKKEYELRCLPPIRIYSSVNGRQAQALRAQRAQKSA